MSIRSALGRRACADCPSRHSPYAHAIHARMSPRGGPRPWRSPRTRADWLLLIASLQLGLLAAAAVQVALFTLLVLPGADAVSCFDGTGPTCGPPEPSAVSYLAIGATATGVLVAAALSVIVTRRHRRGAASRLTAVAVLALPAAALAAGTSLLALAA
jgi:hypothetical protein